MIIPVHPLLLATNIWRPLLEGYFSSCQTSLQLNRVFKVEQFSAVMDFNLPHCIYMNTVPAKITFHLLAFYNFMYFYKNIEVSLKHLS